MKPPKKIIEDEEGDESELDAYVAELIKEARRKSMGNDD